MSPTLSLEVTDKAARQIEDAADWWRRNRPKSPDAVYGEEIPPGTLGSVMKQAGLK